MDTLINYGGEVKAKDNGIVEGYLVRFSTASDPDLSHMRDYFTPNTDYDLEDDGTKRVSVYYAHGLDSTLKHRKLGRAEVKLDDVGLWVEAQLNLRDKYESAVYDMAKAGKLGWSSGAPSHLVERKEVDDAHEVLHWIVAEASLTPSPAEPRNHAITSIKTLEEEFMTGEVKSLADSIMTLTEQYETALDAISEYQTRVEAVKTLRAEAGRTLSDAHRERLETLSVAVADMANSLKTLLYVPPAMASTEDILSAYQAYIEMDIALSAL